MTKYWYIVDVWAGEAERVKEEICKHVHSAGLQERIPNVLAPAEGHPKWKSWKPTWGLVNLYRTDKILVEIEADASLRNFILDTPGVRGFTTEFSLQNQKHGTGVDFRQWCETNGFRLAPDAVRSD